jgi:hypothetical protein
MIRADLNIVLDFSTMMPETREKDRARGYNSMSVQFPNPETQINVLKRYLHILALLQKKDTLNEWNSHTLADILTSDERGDALSDAAIRKYIKTHLVDELGIEVPMRKGARKFSIPAKLSKELHLDIAMLYSNFIAKDDAREIVLQRLLKTHPDDALWLLARLYFARRERKTVTFDYQAHAKQKPSRYTVHPYHIVFRNNNLYLVGHNEQRDTIVLFIINKIHTLEVTDRRFEDKVPRISEIFHDSLGSFIGKKYSVVIHFDESLKPQIEEILSILDPKIDPLKGTDRYKAAFKVSDDLYLCKQLFMYGAKVEIVEPRELRERMRALLRESLRAYDAQ